MQDTDGKPLVEKIKDSAGQKGTGKWTAISALDKGMPVTLIGGWSLIVVGKRVVYSGLFVCLVVLIILPPILQNG